MTFLKNSYLWIIKIISCLYYKKTLQKNKIIGIIDFEEDINEFINSIEEIVDRFEITLYYNPRIKNKLNFNNKIHYKEKTSTTILSMILEIQKAKFVIVDNYVPELGSLKWHPSKTCIQIWHANGALKKFGLDRDKYDESDLKRFKGVYSRYDKILVGSEQMKEIFMKSFNVNENVFLEIGTLRTDKYFRKLEVSSDLMDCLAAKGNRKVILYAPTYREGKNEIAFNHKQMMKWKEYGYTFIVRTHPTVHLDFPENFSDFVINGNQYQLHELMLAADVLITDYSSIAMEFSLLGKPIYFYCYDLNQYRKSPGLIEDFEREICSTIYKDAETLQEAICSEVVKAEDVEAFNAKWNTYTAGTACASLLGFIELRRNNNEVTN